MIENKRFRYDWKTGGFKDTLSNSCATTNMRVLETQINDACFDYEKKIKKLEREKNELEKRLSHEEKVNTGLIEENHKLRLTLIYSSDLNFDINWLKENLKDWNNE